jgi:hypothetical protein
MSMLRRLVVMLFGVVVAIGAALLVLPVAALVDPVTRNAGFAVAEFVAVSLMSAEPEGFLKAGEWMLYFGWAAIMAICVMPLVFSVLLGEIAKVRSFLWYAGATGLIAASAPWVFRAAFHLSKATSASPEELRFAVVFFITGSVSGAVYWLIAGEPGLRQVEARANSRAA